MSKVIDNIEDIASIDSKAVLTTTQTALDLKANLASPALTGTPTAPTASSGTNNTQLATTAFACTMAGGSTIPALSNSQNGYMKMANGIIIQWGVGTIRNGFNAFPLTFPNSVFTVLITPEEGMVYMNTYTTSGYTPHDISDVCNTTNFIAIGY